MIIRDATPDDAIQMADLINQVIAIGGTTAHQHALTPEVIRHYNIDGPECHACVLAEVAGQVTGWQSLARWMDGDHIGTFVRPGLQTKGTGRAMFARTLTHAMRRGLPSIHAWIRADNVAGLAFYGRLGFVDYGGDPSFALDDGQIVGRIFRRFDVV